MISGWRTTIDAVGKSVLPPDPDVLEAIGLSHKLTSAIADLVDNAIDAKATNICVRFVEVEGRLSSLLVSDDGIGMDDEAIDRAMTVGKRREYDDQALGHFGMGLKAASFSQADVLTVMSKRAGGKPVGRRWVRSGAKNFECDVLDSEQVGSELDAAPVEQSAGTIVRWDHIRTFPASDDRRVTDDFLSRTFQELRTHLGLVLHRVLAKSPISITLDVLDADSGETGAPQTIDPVDPFGYRRSGQAGYPKTFECKAGGRILPIHAHIWPARSEALDFRLDGNPERRQGFYFYRNDRLLEGGDWKGATVPSRRLQLARVAVDISDALDLFSMSMEKSTVHPKPEFIRAVGRAMAPDGTTFSEFLETAENVYRVGNQRNRGRKEVVPPGPGLAPAVKRAITCELPIHDGRVPMEIRWKWLPGDDFFEVDRSQNTLWLNTMYRKALLAGRRGGLNDVPVVKALLYLLVEDIFTGSSYGPRDKDNVEIWQSILTAAAQAEAND
ncbi:MULTISPECIES: ATP-binding protein [Rhodococcus]|uniref:ATP-binding protein n=1 Tax=Rhodococcus TaxID=1827 RepID=UPI000C9CBBA5|nr:MULTISPECIES: ATP-binding protein [Rhodococcus]PND52136.1 ATP-binding protein [Rhodococcus sp. ENV425]USC17306.1 ATP-binding protein [Rhodococcus sp. 11-3]WKX00607.1 ATP-binding protein [Rhodococcus aetherivorans]